jgi:hypothetical protein
MKSRFSPRAGLLCAFAFAATSAGWCLYHAAPALAQTFSTPINNASTTLGANYTASSGSLALATGTGARFGSPTSLAPIRVTVASKATLVNAQIGPSTTRTIFLCTGRTGDTLTGLTVASNESTATWTNADHDYVRGDQVSALITAGMISDLQTAIAAAPVDSSVVHKTGAETISGTKTYAAPTKVSGWTGFPAGIVHQYIAADPRNSNVNFSVGSANINGTDTRPDLTLQIGVNNAPGSLEDPTQPAFFDQWEGYYVPSGVLGDPAQFERHIGQLILPGGTVKRPITFVVLRDGSSIGFSFRGNTFEWLDTADASQHLKWTVGSSFQLLKNNYFIHGTNGLSWLQQYPNNASSGVNLIYLDSSNVHQVGAAGYVTNLAGSSVKVAGGISLGGTIGMTNGDTLATTAGLNVAGTLFLGGTEALYKSAAGTVTTDSNLRVGGSCVVNQDQTVAVGQPTFRVRKTTGQNTYVQQWEDDAGTILAGIHPAGGFKPVHLAEASAANDSLYYCTTHSKMEYKDAAGVVNALY